MEIRKVQKGNYDPIKTIRNAEKSQQLAHQNKMAPLFGDDWIHLYEFDLSESDPIQTFTLQLVQIGECNVQKVLSTLFSDQRIAWTVTHETQASTNTATMCLSVTLPYQGSI